MTVDEFISEWNNDAEYVIAHTSGSTGAPKKIKLLKADMRASAAITNHFFNINSESTMMLCLSPDYIAGKMMIVRALLSGATLLLEKPTNKPLTEYNGRPIDLLAVVPSQAQWLAEHPDILPHVRQMIVGGGEMSTSLETKLAKASTITYATYGMTETCSHIALKRITGHHDEPFVAIRPTTLSTDERGCLVINAPQFCISKIVTNDIVELLSPTTFRWKGRFDNVINTGGVKVCPEEIERKIKPLIEDRYYISSKRSEKWGQMVVLVIETENPNNYDFGELKGQLQSVLTNFQMPKEIIFLQRFKETSSGKVIRENFSHYE